MPGKNDARHLALENFSENSALLLLIEFTQIAHFTRAEKLALERFLDLVVGLRAEHPDAHVYHYGSYEEGALKRLATRHATREEELDALLRANAFVDLASITRQAVRIGVESYSLKDLERVTLEVVTGAVLVVIGIALITLF